MRTARLVAFFLAQCVLAASVCAQTPAAITPDGGRYYGPLVNGKREGKGRVEWDNGTRYEGQFKNGLFSGVGRYRFPSGPTYEGQFQRGQMHGRGKYVGLNETYEGEFRNGEFSGQGEIRYKDGRSYRGEFQHGLMHGKGRFENSPQESYEGDFVKGEFTGSGVYVVQGMRHEGQFKNWRPDGPGTFTSYDSSVYEGQFANGEPTGVFKHVMADGSRYEGEIRGWRPHGQGELRSANGDVYKGQFAFGVFSGEGTLTYAQPQADGRTHDSGTWQYGRLKQRDEDEQRRARANIEIALYAQPALLQKTLADLARRDANAINMYLLAIAGDGSQEVFRREVEFVRNQFDTQFGTRGRSIALINSRSTVSTAPMASGTSVRQALQAIAARMNKDKDVLFLFITSHGSSTHEISLGLSGMVLPGLSARELGAALKESGIRWKVVVVSACYAGGFADELRDQHTLFIAAARRDRRSFGCADENDFTYFGRAFFKEALPISASFQDAFGKAAQLIDEWERRDAAKAQSAQTTQTPATQTPADASAAAAQAKDDHHSLPQMESGTAIDTHLQQWWVQHRNRLAARASAESRN